MKTRTMLTLACGISVALGNLSRAQNKIEINPSFRDEEENSSPSYYYPAESDSDKIPPPPLANSVPKPVVPIEEVKINPPIPAPAEIRIQAPPIEAALPPPVKEVKTEVKSSTARSMEEKPSVEVRPAAPTASVTPRTAPATPPVPATRPRSDAAAAPVANSSPRPRVEAIPAPPASQAEASLPSRADSMPSPRPVVTTPSVSTRPEVIPPPPVASISAPPSPRSQQPGAFASTPSPARIPEPPKPAAVTTTPPTLSQGFPAFPPQPSPPHFSLPGNSGLGQETVSATLSNLRRQAYVLGARNIPYRIGVNHPAYGGLDSSGSVQHLLTEIGLSGVPRSISAMHDWLRENRSLREFRTRPTESELSQTLVPGNLLFWGDLGTTRISHVMIYLGYDQSRGRHLAFGSRGGLETGINQSLIDIFELQLNREKLVATGQIPGLILR